VPYPDPTDAVADTWKALQALAAAVNNGAIALSGGLVTMPAANMNGNGMWVPAFPGMPDPLGAMATGAFPSTPAGNRFSYQAKPSGGNIALVQYSVTSPNVGKPVATPPVSSSPVSMITWAPVPAVPAPPDGNGLVRDDWARIQAQAAAVAQRGMPARAQTLSLVAGTGGNIDSSGRFSVTFPDLLVTAAAVCCPGNGYLYYNLTGLGGSTIGVQQYYLNWLNGALNPAGNINTKAAVFAVGTIVQAP
jgi:hypothetical protein